MKESLVVSWRRANWDGAGVLFYFIFLRLIQKKGSGDTDAIPDTKN